jgi:hypothetical protein
MESKIDGLLTVGLVSMHHVRDVPSSASVWLKRKFSRDESNDIWRRRRPKSGQ